MTKTKLNFGRSLAIIIVKKYFISSCSRVLEIVI